MTLMKLRLDLFITFWNIWRFLHLTGNDKIFQVICFEARCGNHTSNHTKTITIFYKLNREIDCSETLLKSPKIWNCRVQPGLIIRIMTQLNFFLFQIQQWFSYQKPTLGVPVTKQLAYSLIFQCIALLLFFWMNYITVLSFFMYYRP